MNYRVKMILILTLFACISGGVLSVVYLFSSPMIEANILKEQREAIFLVVPGASEYTEKKVDDFIYYECRDKSGNISGYAFLAQGNGYQGVIKIMVGVTPDISKITGIKVLEQVETPGLGGRIAEKDFQEQFRGITTEPQIEYVKNQKPSKPNEIQAITGATISSRSVVSIINRYVSKMKTTVAKG